MKKYGVGFAVIGSFMTIAFLIIVNLLTSSEHIWFIYPSVGLLLWPVGLYCMKNKFYKLFAVLCSMLIIIFLIIENYQDTPGYPWALYAVFPVLCWPILMLLGKRAGNIIVSLVGSSIIIIYYLMLNIFLEPGYPWVIFPAFVVLWWPLTIFHVTNKSYFKYSIHASIFVSAFFILVNAISTPHTIWAIYPIFAVLWWPLSMYYFVYKRNLGR
ncbi:hypothetical protein [Oceanobacillus chungangensis]|uniref:Uncharacterized protein n=1 Tax=Oceanobacillus chungangensis TaxID=1229152 RepID=A0A3D8Q079_9BACI|nr:hypothetical protein [Oceanobacillus chungangensis]RDW21237.1 hypothetical protein CWR45_03050 [Oceanobacillus chungangensis]